MKRRHCDIKEITNETSTEIENLGKRIKVMRLEGKRTKRSVERPEIENYDQTILYKSNFNLK